MLEITNVTVSDLEKSIIACRNPMRATIPENTAEEFEKGLNRAIKLVSASAKSPNVKCHDNFLTGIHVSFYLKYTQYITKQFQRYHWFDYVSSSSMMHRLTFMKVNENCAKYVTQASVDQEQAHIDLYNHFKEFKIETYDFVLRSGEVIHATTHKDVMYYQYMICIQNCPMGYELFVMVSTNYKQLQTIYHQRKDHKLREDWGAFCTFVKSLPYATELIIGA